MLKTYEEQYWDFGPTLASEKLFERDGYEVDHETLRRWLKEAGLWERQKNVLSTGKGENRRNTLESWCSWMGAITHGLRREVKKPV